MEWFAKPMKHLTILFERITRLLRISQEIIASLCLSSSSIYLFVLLLRTANWEHMYFVNCHSQDGRIWKERVSAVRRRADIPVMQEGTTAAPEAAGTKSRPPMNRVILPSISAPEHNILKLLEESGI